MKTKPNFRTSTDQTVDFPKHGPSLVTFLGKCPLTGTRLYDLPQTTFREHQAMRFKAADFGLTGPDFIASAAACVDPDSRKIIEVMAKAAWKGHPVKPITNAYVVGVMARKNQCTREEQKQINATAPYLLESAAAEILINRVVKSKMTKT